MSKQTNNLNKTANNSNQEKTKVKLLTGDCVQEMAKLDDNSVDAIVTDPPYGLKFMGKEFDDLGEGAKQREWHKAWAAEALRVLKPGGHLLAFGGTRTYHHLATAVEEVGFEVRDQMQWLYGSGFPKSHNVGKAIDKRGGKKVLWFGPWFREWRKKNDITQKEVAALFPSKTGNLTGCVANWELSFNLPTPEQFNKITEAFDLPFDNIEEAEREVVGKKKSGIANKEEGPRHTIGASKAIELDITAPATEEAARWEGWGTALKPANEPIVVARKPFKGTVAENVLEHGTGAINIDGCRVGTEERETWSAGSANYKVSNPEPWKESKHKVEGRWPANVILDEEAGQLLDQEAKETPSRFFYCPKAAKKERNAGIEDGNKHPTVKPVALMAYLIRLVTPPGGTVLDPFLGSGSTGLAAIEEENSAGFIGIEKDPEYMKIAKARIEHWQKEKTPSDEK